jgi:hypothetical protein
MMISISTTYAHILEHRSIAINQTLYPNAITLPLQDWEVHHSVLIDPKATVSSLFCKLPSSSQAFLEGHSVSTKWKACRNL